MRGSHPKNHPWSYRAFASVRVGGFQNSRRILKVVVISISAFLISCSPKSDSGSAAPAPSEVGALCRVGAIAIYQADLDRELKERHVGSNDRVAVRRALDDLVARAQLAAAALDADVQKDPAVRAEIARILASRLKESALTPLLSGLGGPIPEARLRELYQAEIDRFQSGEKRRTAVLWLNPKGSPEREKQYMEKLTTAREWLENHGDIKGHPEKGFSVLSVDHSEHAGSRYQGGVIGWLAREGGMDAWTSAVAEIVFALGHPGDVSPATVRAEGVFLVRYMELQPAVTRSFDEVAGELENAERRRLRAAAEAEFAAAIKSKYPAQWFAEPISVSNQ